MTTGLTYTYEQYDAIVAHNLTLRTQLERCQETSQRRLDIIKEQATVVASLLTLLSKVGWHTSRSATRMMLDARGAEFVTIQANRGPAWGLHEGDEWVTQIERVKR